MDDQKKIFIESDSDIFQKLNQQQTEYQQLLNDRYENLQNSQGQEQYIENSKKQFIDYFIKINQRIQSHPNLVELAESFQDVDNLTYYFQQKLQANGYFAFKNQANDDLKNRKDVEIQVLDRMENNEIVQILCRLGKYARKFTVFNHIKESFRHTCKVIGMGTYGEVYQLNQQTTVVKCLKFNKQNPQQIKNHIKQFFLIHLMSTLQVGPKCITQRNGFGFVLFQNCLEFQMQRCYPLKQINLKHDLIINLVKMHHLRIIHSDIKPANIMYSESYNKNVFIDFGISQILNQKRREKTLTNFKGTYQYCGLEMKQLFGKKLQNYINLYQNDVQMLINTLREILLFSSNKSQNSLMQKIMNQSNENQQNVSQIDQYLQSQSLLLLKFNFYQIFQNIQTSNKQNPKQIQIISKILNNNNSQMIIQQIVIFSQKLNQSFYDTKFQKQSINMMEIIKNQILLKNRTFQQIQRMNQNKEFQILSIQTLSEQFLLKNYGGNQNYKKLHNIIQHIYSILSKSSNKLNKNHRNEGVINGQFQFTKQNLSFVLLNNDQMLQNFKFQEVLNMFLSYVSFWKSTFCNSIQQKEKIAFSVKKYIQICSYKILKSSQLIQSSQTSTLSNIRLEDLTFYQHKYLPQYKFIKQNCKSLIWMYSFLLEYCLNESKKIYQSQKPYKQNFLRFKMNNLLTVVKDSIFLQFQYYHFTNLCIQKYFNYLVLSKSEMILTQTIIECFDLIYLTEEHFLVSNNTQVTFKEKYLRENIQDIFIGISQKLNLVDDFDLLKPKMNLLCDCNILFYKQLHIDEMFIIRNRKQLYENYFSDFLNQIQNQLKSSNQDIKSQQLCQKTRFLIKIQFRQLKFDPIQAFKNSKQNITAILQASLSRLDILDFMDSRIDQLTFSSYQQSSRSFEKLDRLINCQQITFYFYLHERVNYYAQNPNLLHCVRQILQLFLGQNNSCAGLLNYNQFIDLRIFDSYKLMLYEKAYPQCWSLKFCQIKRVSLLIIKHLAYNQNKIFYVQKIHQCLKAFDKVKNTTIDPKIIEPIQQQARQLLINIHGSNFLYRVNWIISTSLNDLLPPFSQQSLLLKLQFYKFIIRTFRSSDHLDDEDHEYHTKNQHLFQQAKYFKRIFYKQSSKSKYMVQIAARTIHSFYVVYHNRFNLLILVDNFQSQLVKNNNKYWEYIKLINFLSILNRHNYYINDISTFLIKSQNNQQICNYIIQTARNTFQYQEFTIIIQFIQILHRFPKIFKGNLIQFYTDLLNIITKKINSSKYFKQQSLLPVYLHILNQNNFLIQQQPKIWKNLLLKSYEFFPKYTNFNATVKFYTRVKRNIVCVLKYNLWQASFKYVLNFKNLKKQQIIMKRFVMFFNFQSYLDFNKIHVCCSQFVFKQFSVQNHKISSYTTHKAITLLKRNKRKMLLSDKSQFVYLEKQTEFKRLFTYIFDRKNSFFEDNLKLQQAKSQFCQRYSLISFSLFENFYRQNFHMNCQDYSKVDSQFYDQQVNQKEKKYLSKKSKFYEVLFNQTSQRIEKIVLLLKQSKMYAIYEQSSKVIEKIITEQYKVISERLFTEYGKTVDSIGWVRLSQQQVPFQN